MIWLAAQLIVELLIAAGIGGVIGWALHMRFGKPAAAEPATSAATGVSDPDGRVKIAELESQLRADREELADLRRKLAAASAKKPEGGAEDEGTLAWRNRYLDNKVRFLEGKVADLEAAAAPDHPPEDQNDEPTRLRWRNRYLDGRVRYLEEELKRNGSLIVAQVASAPVAPAPTPASISRPMTMPAEATQPPSLPGPRNGVPDNLRQIAGVGPKLEQMLHTIGVYHIDQIAAWTPREINWVNAAMSFRGRIERDRWVDQAKALVEKRGPKLDFPT